MSFNNQRRHAEVISKGCIGHFYVPYLLTGARIERDQMRVRCSKEQPVAIHRHTALADKIPAGLPLKMPNLPAGSPIDGPNVIRDSEVQSAVDLERHTLDSLLMSLERPGQ